MLAPFQFFVVRPHPPAPGFADRQDPHLIIQQLPQPGQRSVLISASMTTRHPGQFVHWATAMPAVVQKVDILREARVTWECEPLTDDRKCQVWRGNQLCTHNGALGLAPGDSIVFLAQDTGSQDIIPTQEGQEDDALWLAQQQVSRLTKRNSSDQRFGQNNQDVSRIPRSLRSLDAIDLELSHLPESDELSTMAMHHQPGLPQDEHIMERPDIAVAPADDDLQDLQDLPDLLPAQEEAQDLDYETIPVDTYLVQIFPLGAPPVRGRLPIHAPHLFLPQAANLLGIEYAHLLLCHAVQTPPQDLHRSMIIPYIAQETGQLMHGDPLSYVLMDVEFHHRMPAVTPQATRTAKLIPNRITRENILKIVGIKRYCEDVMAAPLFDATACLVWINGNLLGMEPPRAVDIDHGEYIRVMIPPHPKFDNGITTKEMAELCFHHLEDLATLGNDAFNYVPDQAVELPHDIDIVVNIPGSDEELDALELIQLTQPIGLSLDVLPEAHLDDPTGEDQFDTGPMTSSWKLPQPLQDITNTLEPVLGPQDLQDQCHRHERQPSSTKDIALPHGALQKYELSFFERDLLQQLQDRNVKGLFDLDFSFKVLTWYVDQHRIPAQKDCREVWLRNLPSSWKDDLLTVWHDVALLDQVAHFFVVNPQPIRQPPDEALHVLIVQTPIPGLASFMLHIKVEDRDHNIDILRADTVSRVAGHEMMYQLAQVGHYCSLGQDDHLCTVSLAEEELPENRPILVEDALTIKVTVHNSLTADHALFDEVRHLIREDEFEDDSLQLLQKFHGVVKRAGSLECPFGKISDDPIASGSLSLEPPQAPTSADEITHDRPSEPSGTTLAFSPVRLSLDACIQPNSRRPTWQPEAPAYLMFEQPDWYTTIQQGQPLPFAPLPDGLSMPKSSYYAFMTMEEFDWNRSITWEMYVDGSTSMIGAGWAAVLVAYNGEHRAFAGCLHGLVTTNPEDNNWIGAVTVDNIAAEFNAMLIALLAVHRCPGYQQSIRPDLSLSRLLAQAQCTTTSNPILAKLVSALGSWLMPNLQIEEIRGHSSDPWNDLADALAKYTVHSSICTEGLDLQAVHALASSKVDLDWLWIQDEPLLQRTLPPLFDGQVIQVEPSLRKTSPRRAQPPQPQPLRLQGKVITANVLSLETARTQRTVGRLGGHRTVRLASQWHKDKIHVIGVQEARTPAGKTITDHYLILSSGCDTSSTAQHGCELWLHRSLPFFSAPGMDFCLAEGKLAIQHADPRRLCVRITTSAADVTFIVLHAPCLRHLNNGVRAIDAVREWWEETTRLLRSFPASDLLFVMADANAPLASRTSDYFSNHAAEPTNEVGAIFETFLEDMELTVPSTFDFWHTGSSTTWTHSSGQRMRRDG